MCQTASAPGEHPGRSPCDWGGNYAGAQRDDVSTREYCYRGESLGYLFDSSVQTGKISHMGVTGLLQAKGGYYEYDSSRNYAAYNANKNAFDVYNAAGVMQAGAGSQNGGQFSPSMRPIRYSRR